MHSIASKESCLSVYTLQLDRMSKCATKTFHMSSILDMLTSAVSTKRVIANVLTLAITSASFGLLVAPFIFDCLFSKTPIVSCPNDVTSSARH